MGPHQSVREAHEEFVSGHNGTTAFEVVTATSAVFPALLLNAIVVQGRCGWQWFIFESIILILPLVLSLTVLSDYTFQFWMAVICATTSTLVMASKFNFPVCRRSYVDEKRIGCVTSLRGMLNLVAAVVILAVDFHAFPRRFAKTEDYGYSLMDMGAGGFVIANGIVEGRKKPKMWSVVRDTTALIVLGLGRLWLVRASDYQHHVTEYGLHANFFFTLAFVKVTCSCWAWRLNLSGAVVCGVCLCVCHQVCLTVGGGAAWVLGSGPRDTLINANREWLVSMPGYLASYFFGVALGLHLFAGFNKRVKLTFTILVGAMILLLWVTCLHYSLGPPSRRLANTTFIMFAVFFTTYALANYLLVETLAALTLPGLSAVPVIFQAINRRPLLCFLLANVSTGLLNMSINTLDFRYPSDVYIIGAYTVSICFVLYFLFLRDIRRERVKL